MSKMTTLTVLYSRNAAATTRLTALTAAYADMPKARESMAGNPKALAFINTASEFQATLRNTISASCSSIVQEFGASAVPAATGKPGDATAQLAIANEQPAVNNRLNALLTAHKTYLASLPKQELSFSPRRLWSALTMGR